MWKEKRHGFEATSTSNGSPYAMGPLFCLLEQLDCRL